MLMHNLYIITNDLINGIILFSLLVAIGIEAFNRFSQLRNEEKSKNSEVVMTPKVSRQEDEVSAVTGFSSIQNVIMCYEHYFCYNYYRYNIIMYFMFTHYFSHLQKNCCLTS